MINTNIVLPGFAVHMHKDSRLTEEHKIKIGIGNRGKMHSKEQNENHSKAMRGKGNPNYGKRRTKETKALIGVGNKGKKRTEETKVNISKALKGNQNALGHKHTEDQNVQHSAVMKGLLAGEKHYNYGKRGRDAVGYRGGKKVAIARANAKRRELGHALLMPLVQGDVYHHVTDKLVVGMQAAVHQQFSGYNREKHRLLVLEWLKDNDIVKYDLVFSVLNIKKEPIR